MMRKQILPLLALAASVFGPAPVLAFDCAKARTPMEKAICGSPELLAADRKLDDTYQALAGKLDPAARQRLTGLERGWLKNAAACFTPKRPADDSRKCLAEAYAARIAELAGDAHPADGVLPVVARFGDPDAHIPGDRPPAPSLRLAAWLERVKAAKTVDAFADAMTAAQPDFGHPFDDDDFKVDGKMPAMADAATVAANDQETLRLAVGSAPITLPPVGRLTAVTVYVTLVHADEYPDWFWLGLFRTDAGGNDRLVASIQNLGSVCGYVDDGHEYEPSKQASALAWTRHVVLSCGTLVEAATKPIECFMPDGRLVCVSGGQIDTDHFDRLHPQDDQ